MVMLGLIPLFFMALIVVLLFFHRLLFRLGHSNAALANVLAKDSQVLDQLF